MDRYYIHEHLNEALKMSNNKYSIINFELDGIYSITTSEGKYDESKLQYFIEISREDLIATIQGRTYDSLMEQSINLQELLLKNKKNVLRLSRMEYDNI